MENSNKMQSKRFVVRQSLIGKKATYNHDAAYEVMKTKLLAMNCWTKYKSYTSSSNLPVAVRAITE